MPTEQVAKLRHACDPRNQPCRNEGVGLSAEKAGELSRLIRIAYPIVVLGISEKNQYCSHRRINSVAVVVVVVVHIGLGELNATPETTNGFRRTR